MRMSDCASDDVEAAVEGKAEPMALKITFSNQCTESFPVYIVSESVASCCAALCTLLSMRQGSSRRCAFAP
jgi:hypothetical protein